MTTTYELARKLRNLETKHEVKERRLIERRDENDLLREQVKDLEKRITKLTAELETEKAFRKIRMTARGKRILEEART